MSGSSFCLLFSFFIGYGSTHDSPCSGPFWFCWPCFLPVCPSFPFCWALVTAHTASFPASGVSSYLLRDIVLPITSAFLLHFLHGLHCNCSSVLSSGQLQSWGFRHLLDIASALPYFFPALCCTSSLKDECFQPPGYAILWLLQAEQPLQCLVVCSHKKLPSQ